MTLIELTLSTAIKEAGEYGDVRLLKEDAEHILGLLKEREDLGTELTNAVELIHKKNERIEELLKEQEPKPVELHTNAYGTKFYFCPKCKRELFHTRNLNFCERCGQEVKWDG